MLKDSLDIVSVWTLLTIYLFCILFDYVVRDSLWYKLIKLGIRGRMLNIILGMYSCTKYFVKIHGSLSEPFLCENGVRQRECISPFLFAIYINDLEETLIVKGIKGIDIGIVTLFLLLYTGDIVLLAENTDDTLHDYCIRWKLLVNIEKTKIMIGK